MVSEPRTNFNFLIFVGEIEGESDLRFDLPFFAFLKVMSSFFWSSPPPSTVNTSYSVDRGLNQNIFSWESSFIVCLKSHLTMGGSEDARPSDKTSSRIGDLFFLKRSFTRSGDWGPQGSAVAPADLVFLGEISCTETTQKYQSTVTSLDSSLYLENSCQFSVSPPSSSSSLRSPAPPWSSPCPACRAATCRPDPARRWRGRCWSGPRPPDLPCPECLRSRCRCLCRCRSWSCWRRPRCRWNCRSGLGLSHTSG